MYVGFYVKCLLFMAGFKSLIFTTDFIITPQYKMKIRPAETELFLADGRTRHEGNSCFS
jgi:hypothetical protein